MSSAALRGRRESASSRFSMPTSASITSYCRAGRQRLVPGANQTLLEMMLPDISRRSAKDPCKVLPLSAGGGLVPPAGFEPTTVRLEGGCSILLSYGGMQDARNYKRYGA